MRPYSEEEKKFPLKIKRIQKPLPSYDLVKLLTNVIGQQPNFYNRKNHVLTINDYEVFSCTLKNINRTPYSFQKQLKMLGYKRIKSNLWNNQVADNKSNQGHHQSSILIEDKPQQIIWIWKGNKEILINEEVIQIQQNLTNHLEYAQLVKFYMSKQKQQIDDKLQTIIVKILANSFNSQKQIQQLTADVKQGVNQVQRVSSIIASHHSQILLKQLELYRLLTYKDNKKLG